jgi:hypothetical protein
MNAPSAGLRARVLMTIVSATAMFSMGSLKPGLSDTACIKVTSNGTLPNLLRLYGTTTGTGLDAYLNVVVTRGTGGTSFDDCTGFAADTSDWRGLGAGVVYSGTLQAFPDDWAGGVVDPRVAVPEAWTTGETHTYRFAVTLADTDAAQGLTATQTFTWEARNTSLYSQVVLSDGPASYWKLDEAAGTTATDTAGGISGTYTNGPVLNQTSGVKDAGTAVSLDGVNDFISMGDVYDFAGNAPFSIELWVNRSSTVQRGLVSKYNGGTTYGWYLGLLAAGHPTSPGVLYIDRYNTTAGSELRGTTNLLPDRWYHVAATYDGATLRLYVNGSQESSMPAPDALLDTTTPMGTSTFPGLMDELAVYTRALTAQQVGEHFAAGRR